MYSLDRPDVGLLLRGGEVSSRCRPVAAGLMLAGHVRSSVPTCALCRRRFEGDLPPQAIQEHHLRPEERAESPTVTLCRPCHDQVHALFTNAELREAFDDVESLRGADRLQDYLDWIRGTDKLDIQVRSSDRLRGSR